MLCHRRCCARGRWCQFNDPDPFDWLAACGKADKDTARQSIERLTVAATNGYGEEIRRPKGISLVERRQEKVRKGQVDKSTGEIYQRSGKRSVKSVVASVVTRLTDWVLAPKKTHGFAVRMAQERAHQRDAVSSPAGLGKQARSAFWSAMATAWASLYPAERFPAVTPAEPPAPAKSWPALLASWGIAPQNPVTA